MVLSTWFENRMCWSKVTPSSFTSDFSQMSTSLMLIGFDVMCFCSVKVIATDLLVFSSIELSAHQSTAYDAASCNGFSVKLMVALWELESDIATECRFTGLYTVVSSAYLICGILGHRSWTNTFHNTGPMIVPWGTPMWEDRYWENWQLYLTRCCLDVKKPSTTFTSDGWMFSL